MSINTCCMNIDTAEVSEWSIAFNRIWRVRGSYYGLSRDGVFLISSPDDDGVPIESVVVTSPNDAESENLKRVAYSRVECSGDSSVEVLVDGVSGGTAFMNTSAKRAKFARGVRGRFVSFTVTSSDPVFYLYEISANIETMKRGYQ